MPFRVPLVYKFSHDFCFFHYLQLQLIFFWIPDLTVPLIVKVSNVSEALAESTIIPLKICLILTFTGKWHFVLKMDFFVSFWWPSILFFQSFIDKKIFCFNRKKAQHFLFSSNIFMHSHEICINSFIISNIFLKKKELRKLQRKLQLEELNFKRIGKSHEISHSLFFESHKNK